MSYCALSQHASYLVTRKRKSKMAPPKKKKKIPKCKKKKFLSQRGKKSDGDSEYCPSSKEDTKCKQLEFDGLEVELERRLFVCESTQLMDMVKQINASSKCSTPECSGEYLLFYFLP